MVTSGPGVLNGLLGLESATAVDTFEDAGSLSSVNIPLVLAKTERAGMLRTGDRVVTFGGGSGVTYASVALRWGGDSAGARRAKG